MTAVQLEMFAPLATPLKPVKAKKADNTEAITLRTLTDCLPPGVPPSFKKIAAARFKNRNTIVATLVMFDDLPGIVHLARWRFGWSHRWEWTPGQYLSWDGNQWQRIDEDSTN